MSLATTLDIAGIDISVRAGNNLSQPFRWLQVAGGAPVDLTGSTLRFRTAWSGGALAKAVTITNAAGGEFTLDLTVAETRALPIGRVAFYEIERRIGASQKTIIEGFLDVSKGVNDD